MDLNDLFSFFTRDQKTHFSITVPGAPTSRLTKMNLCKNEPQKPLTERDLMEVVSCYQDQGLLAGYTETDIDNMRRAQNGWTIAYPPISNPQIQDARIFEESAYQFLSDRLWRPLLSAIPASYTDAECTLSPLPKIVTLPFVESWYRANQKESAYLNRLKQKSLETQIVRRDGENETVLKITGHPFVNQPIERVLLFPTNAFQAPKRLTASDQDMLRLKLLRRDTYHLKGLTDAERAHLAHTKSVNDTYQIHWIKWLSLGGDMTAKNAFLVTRDTQLKYRILVQEPFHAYWDQNAGAFTQSGKRVVAEIPVPLTAYRPTPIRPVHTKRQDRYHLNRLTKLAADNYQYEN